MKLTRNKLKQILERLPDPAFVEAGVVSRIISVPVHNAKELITENDPTPQTLSIKITELTFEYSPIEMDWVLNNLDV